MLSARFVCFFSSLSIATLLNVEASRLSGEGILGGDLAHDGQFPYQALLFLSNDFSSKCGGAIISERHILTAAHCVIDAYGFFGATLKVKVGVADGNKCAKDHEVQRIYLPWEYTPKGRNRQFNVTHDIAVLKLKESLDLSVGSGLQAVNLPKPVAVRNNRSLYRDYVNEKAVLSGYGFNSMTVWMIEGSAKLREDGSSDNQLRFAEATVLDNAHCRTLMKEGDVNGAILCARVTPREGTKRGACASDSGGPLVVDNTLIGVLVASPVGCSEKKRPARYSRVSCYMSFIENALRERDLRRMRVAELSVQYEMIDASKNSPVAQKYWRPDEF